MEEGKDTQQQEEQQTTAPTTAVAEEAKTAEKDEVPKAPEANTEAATKDDDPEDEDAEKAKGSWWGSSWGSGWGKTLTNAFNVVKEVSTNVAEICVQDLKDFRGQIQEDTTKAINRKKKKCKFHTHTQHKIT